MKERRDRGKKGNEREWKGGMEDAGGKGGEKTIKTVNRHFRFPWLHLIITSHTSAHTQTQFTGILRQADQTQSSLVAAGNTSLFALTPSLPVC